MIAEMPDNRFAPMTTFNDMKAADDDNIQKAVETLRTASGSIDTPRLARIHGGMGGGETRGSSAGHRRREDTYRKRAAVIGFRCGVISQSLAGEENDHCLDFARMMAEYTLKEQSKLFGGYLTDERQITETKANDGNSNILMHLPEQFTMDDACDEG